MTSLEKYEENQDKIKKLQSKINAGLEKHDRKASMSGGHDWGFVGDLEYVISQLQEASDFLNGEGDYA